MWLNKSYVMYQILDLKVEGRMKKYMYIVRWIKLIFCKFHAFITFSNECHMLCSKTVYWIAGITDRMNL